MLRGCSISSISRLSTALTSDSVLPEEMAKRTKTDDQFLAQPRASSQGPPSPMGPSAATPGRREQANPALQARYNAIYLLGLEWAKKMIAEMPSKSLAEIQAIAQTQAAAAAAAATVLGKLEPVPIPAPIPTPIPAPDALLWGGPVFHDTELKEVPQPTPAPAPAPAVAPPEKASPEMEFETWCITELGLWSSKIDVPTFVAFLKDIETPHEVNIYVKGYLGDSKASNDFARQFLERRSKLLRSRTVIPSDDLCSPAAAINPRAAHDHLDSKGKGKKTKKNKMPKIDSWVPEVSVRAGEASGLNTARDLAAQRNKPRIIDFNAPPSAQ